MKQTERQNNQKLFGGELVEGVLNNRERIKEVLKILFWIALVVALGIFAVNQTLTYYYKAEFLKSPCHLCAKLNPNQSLCIQGCFIERTNLYPDGFGGWNALGEFNNISFNLSNLN